MTKLEQLIADLCPDGVEYKKLGDIAEIRSGWGFPNNLQGRSSGEYPFYKVSDMNSPGNERSMSHAINYVTEDTARSLGCKPAPPGTVIFPKIGVAISTNKKRILSVVACYDNNVVGLIPSSHIHPRYLLYLFYSYDLTSFSDFSGALPSIRKSTLEKLPIPIPPLPVQEEIVRILDKFTALEAELEAELEARKKQYEYYRNELLSFGDDVGRKGLGEIANMKAGTFIQAHEIALTSGNESIYPCYGGNGFRGFVKNHSHNGKYLLIGRQGALCGNVRRVDGEFYATEHAVVLSTKPIVNTDWLFHMLTHANLNQYATKSAQPGLSVATISQLPIPLPSLSEQERIVAILDRFDALVNDISSGLPAEIAARRKQYECYRDRLLTFEHM